MQTKEIHGQDQYGLAVYATWKLSYDKLGPSAKALLQVCSHLHHEGIMEEIFKNASLSQMQLDDSNVQMQVAELLIHFGKQDSKWNSFLFQKIIGESMSYSLMEFDSQNQGYSMHPLVQHWSASLLGKNQHDKKKCVLSMIGLSILWRFNIEDHRYQQRLLQHITRSRGTVKAEEISYLIASNLALVYKEHGKWKEAEALQVVVMEKTKHGLGEEHPDTLTSMANLAGTYRKQGRWKEAEALEVVVVEKRKHGLGEKHPDTLRSMANVAVTYRNQGRWKEAEALEVVVIEKRKHSLGEEHPHRLEIMQNLASTYRNQG